MARLADIRSGLAATIQRHVGRSVQCSPYPPRTVNSPAGFPAGRSGGIDDMDGSRRVTVPWWVVIVPKNTAQFDTIDTILDDITASVPAAIDAEPDLGLDGVDARCGDWVEGEVDVGPTTYWGVRFDIEILYAPDTEEG